LLYDFYNYIVNTCELFTVATDVNIHVFVFFAATK